MPNPGNIATCAHQTTSPQSWISLRSCACPTLLLLSQSHTFPKWSLLVQKQNENQKLKRTKQKAKHKTDLGSRDWHKDDVTRMVETTTSCSTRHLTKLKRCQVWCINPKQHRLTWHVNTKSQGRCRKQHANIAGSKTMENLILYSTPYYKWNTKTKTVR